MFRLLPILSWLAFPAYVWQGVGVRLRTERLLPAEGRVLHRIPGEGEPFNLLVIGDSSAASVGVGSTEDGLAARLSALVAERTGRPVSWRAAGFNSATSGQLRDFVVPNLAPEEWTHVILAVGTNDMKNFHTARRFRAEFGSLLYAVRAKWPQALVLWSPVIDMRRVPALPGLLARVLEIRARLINHVGTQLCMERGAITATRLPVEDPRAGFSRDGFHASEAGYDAWARHLLPFVLDAAPIEAGSEPSAS